MLEIPLWFQLARTSSNPTVVSQYRWVLLSCPNALSWLEKSIPFVAGETLHETKRDNYCNVPIAACAEEEEQEEEESDGKQQPSISTLNRCQMVEDLVAKSTPILWRPLLKYWPLLTQKKILKWTRSMATLSIESFSLPEREELVEYLVHYCHFADVPHSKAVGKVLQKTLSIVTEPEQQEGGQASEKETDDPLIAALDPYTNPLLDVEHWLLPVVVDFTIKHQWKTEDRQTFIVSLVWLELLYLLDTLSYDSLCAQFSGIDQ